MEQNNRYEEEIDLKDLMYAVFRKWRSVIVVGIIVAILLGMYKGIPAIKAVNDPNVLANNQKVYNDALVVYSDNKERLEKEITNIEKDINQKEDYLENSLLMQINPYDKHVANINYYVNAEEYEFKVINYYLTYAQGGDLYARVAEKLKKDIDYKYLSEVLVFSADYDSNMFTVNLVCDDLETTSLIINCVKEELEEKSIEIEQKVGEHVFKIVNETQYQTIDLGLESTINNNKLTIENLKVSLEQKQTEYNALAEPKLAVTSYTGAVKSMIKYIIIGGVLGVFLAAAYDVFLYLISDKLHDRKALRNRYQLKLIGDLSEQKYGKLFGKLDRWLAKVFGQNVLNVSQEEVYQVIAANLSVLSSNEKGNREYLITGSVTEDSLKSIQSKLNSLGRLKEINLTCGGNITTTALTIEKASKCDGIILVEKLNSSSMAEIEREIEALKNIGKDILGVVLI